MMERPKDARSLTTADLAEAGEENRIESDREREARARAFQRPEPAEVGTRDDDARNVERMQNEGGNPEEPPSSLFEPSAVKNLRGRWDSIQTRFVDEPRIAVEEADGLVAATIKDLAESFAKQRAELEHRWTKGNDVSTEDLRLALRRYRSFFQRLLAA